MTGSTRRINWNLVYPNQERDAFYSILTGSELSVKDYEDILETCRMMGITDFREFHDPLPTA